MTESKTLAEAYPIEQARLRELIEAYRSIGPAGTFGIAMIRQTLAKADAAAASGDVVAMLRAFEEMKECQ
jgi:hypothetical protein